MNELAKIVIDLTNNDVDSLTKYVENSREKKDKVLEFLIFIRDDGINNKTCCKLSIFLLKNNSSKLSMLFSLIDLHAFKVVVMNIILRYCYAYCYNIFPYGMCCKHSDEVILD